MTNERHTWTKDDRMLVCTILKRLGFRYPTYQNRTEYTEIGRRHKEMFEKTAKVMSIVTGKQFSQDQIAMQLYKNNMHKQLKDGAELTPAQFEMLKCMFNTNLLDCESFYNMHYGWHEQYSRIAEEDEIIKKAIQIQKERSNMKI